MLITALLGISALLPPNVAPPDGWWVASRAPTLVRFTLDSAVAHGGRASGRLEVTYGSRADVSGSARQSIRADAYRGQRVRLSGWIRMPDTASVTAWLRVEGAQNNTVTTFAISNGDKQSITASGEWQRIDRVLDVPGRADAITLGVTLYGKGTVWLDDFSLEPVDRSVPSTNSLTEPLVLLGGPEVQQRTRDSWETLPAHPLNLDFEGARAPTLPGPSPNGD